MIRNSKAKRLLPVNIGVQSERSFMPKKSLGKHIHAHDYRDGKLYKDLRVLCIGGSYSAEDIALQCWKYGSKYAHITHRRATPMGFKWPETVIERPILTDINGSTVTFKDGSTEEYDVIIKCTGYLHDFPFMRHVSTSKTNRYTAVISGNTADFSLIKMKL